MKNKKMKIMSNILQIEWEILCNIVAKLLMELHRY